MTFTAVTFCGTVVNAAVNNNNVSALDVNTTIVIVIIVVARAVNPLLDRLENQSRSPFAQQHVVLVASRIVNARRAPFNTVAVAHHRKRLGHKTPPTPFKRRRTNASPTRRGIVDDEVCWTHAGLVWVRVFRADVTWVVAYKRCHGPKHRVLSCVHARLNVKPCLSDRIHPALVKSTTRLEESR